MNKNNKLLLMLFVGASTHIIASEDVSNDKTSSVFSKINYEKQNDFLEKEKSSSALSADDVFRLYITQRFNQARAGCSAVLPVSELSSHVKDGTLKDIK